MLKNVLGVYLDKMTERQLDLPLLLLLPAMGYFDVHFTHGAEEHGKDFIAKKRDNDEVIQYAIQSKIKDINLTAWRDVRPQVIEAMTNGLSHPNFDRALPRRVVLITTGDLVGGAKTSVQDFNRDFVQSIHQSPLLFWGKQNLIEMFEEYGIASTHRVTAGGFAEYGRFFLVYANAMQGNLSGREIEEYSRRWTDTTLDRESRLLVCALESEIVAQQCIEQGFYYEAIVAHLARLRTLCTLAYSDDASDVSYGAGLYTESATRLHDLCAAYLTEIQTQWRQQGDLLTMIVMPPRSGRYAVPPMATYPAQCARIMEVAALVYFTASDDREREETASFLEEFILGEPGCHHPLSNRYAVTIVLACLILLGRNRRETVRDLLKQVTLWVCDRYEQGMGLAQFDATEEGETTTLLGYAFASVAVSERRASFLAAALCDLAAFLGDGALYGDIVNEIKASEVYPEYWQATDTVGVCSIESADITQYPHVPFEDSLTDFHQYQHAPHFSDEPETFRVAELFSKSTLVVLMVLLRDRYFPKAWAKII